MTQVAQGSLTILNAHEATPTVFWNGIKLEGITAINIANGGGMSRVVLTLQEDPILAEMQAAGITIKRSAV
jgi:hypothetical protein